MIGIDEVGRGPWAGPVVASAVRLNTTLNGLTDSKKLSHLQRVELDKTIRKSDADIGIGWVSASDIDIYGLSWAVSEAMRRAISMLNVVPGEVIIIDGNQQYLPEYESAVTLIGADGTDAAVSAASIVAKVARDAYMVELDKTLPGYCFAAHKGYGTKVHRDALTLLGVTNEHRRSFKPVAALC